MRREARAAAARKRQVPGRRGDPGDALRMQRRARPAGLLRRALPEAARRGVGDPEQGLDAAQHRARGRGGGVVAYHGLADHGARDGEQDVLGFVQVRGPGPRRGRVAGPLERHEVVAGDEPGVAVMEDGVQRADEAPDPLVARGRRVAEDPAPRARARAPRVAPGFRDVAFAHDAPAALRDVGARQEVLEREGRVGFVVEPLVGVVDRVAVHHEVPEREVAIDDLTRRRAPPQVNDAPPRGGLRRVPSGNEIGVVAGALRRRVEDARAPRPRALIDVERIRRRWRRRRHAHVAAAVAHRARHVAVVLVDRQERAERRRGPHGARGAAGLRHRELAPGLEQRVQAVQHRRRREVRVLEHEPRAAPRRARHGPVDPLEARRFVPARGGAPLRRLRGPGLLHATGVGARVAAPRGGAPSQPLGVDLLEAAEEVRDVGRGVEAHAPDARPARLGQP